ncbi:hypothetical protein B0H17DRAFT_1218226 [Mycena rosella]|uniref:Uncharacterized protein n=1 Tax=Mycena rosella TaxID=1033263 RepID=A0AAD7FKM3_MYCRO|nr:hypothetical protein B0H17DRAFT_1218226 [Mycena rosella]
MSSDDERNESTIPAKKRRVQRACDACRLKKSRLLPSSMYFAVLLKAFMT